MKSKKKILGLILARGSSKSIKNKNIINFCGKPLISWTINSALKSKLLNDVVLSTDSKQIAKVGKKFGAQVPFIRPSKLAKDTTPSIDAVLHAIKWFKRKKIFYDLVVLLEPTSPLRDNNDIDRSIKKIIKRKGESLVSTSKAEKLNPAYLYSKTKLEKIRPIKSYTKQGGYKYIRRQDLDDIYFSEGTIYISKVKTLLKKKTFFHKETLMYVLPKWKSLEIDDKLDLILAEAIIKNKRKL